MQFTPDVLPSDVTGYCVPEKDSMALHYRPGAVMCCLFLADELNRATSRTQSALLEAMEEGQVTVDGISHRLPQPFVVVATQNPTGAAGTQLLPDSQLDRFMVRLTLGYPEAKDEISMAKDRQGKNPLEEIRTVVTAATLMELRTTVEETYISDELIAYVVDLMNATRQDENLLQGASPRATLAVIAMAKAVARLGGRDYVVPQDIRQVLLPTVSHRLPVTHAAKSQNMTADTVLQQILDRIPAPKLR
jgi:MoxR-like ATPase